MSLFSTDGRSAGSLDAEQLAELRVLEGKVGRARRLVADVTDPPVRNSLYEFIAELETAIAAIKNGSASR